MTAGSCASSGLVATCNRCARMMSMSEQNALLAAVACPTCGEPDQFGPGVYVEGFAGYTVQQALLQRRGKLYWTEAELKRRERLLEEGMPSGYYAGRTVDGAQERAR